MQNYTLLSQSEDATFELGARFTQLLKPGAVVALFGDLGCGKTVFTRGIASASGIDEPVTSPTFTIVQEYRREDGTLFFHLDMYRIDNEDCALAFGVEEFLFTDDAVAVVEWSERIEGLLDEVRDLHVIRFQHISENRRKLELCSSLVDQIVTNLPEGLVSEA